YSGLMLSPQKLPFLRSARLVREFGNAPSCRDDKRDCLTPREQDRLPPRQHRYFCRKWDNEYPPGPFLGKKVHPPPGFAADCYPEPSHRRPRFLAAKCPSAKFHSDAVRR